MDNDFGAYELRDRIGKGGMAWVYLAMQKNLDRPVALKILFPHLAEDEKLVARFQLEARSAAQMRHENVCQVYDFGRHGEQFYIAMEYVEGANLRDWIDDRGTPPMEIALLMLRDICRGLEHAHRRNIIHRDIKPSNVMFTPEGVIKLMDFGLARRAEDTTGITMVGAMLGTPAYMSPEQARGERLDRATTDIFSFGIVCYELLSGSRPFQGDTSSIARAILYAEPRPLDALDPLVPPEVEAMIRRMLEKDATQRVQTVTEVRQAFDRSIAALGLTHDRSLLADYAADPVGVGGTLRAKRLARHLEDARAAEERGDAGALLRAYRCVAYLDPRNETAARYVKEHDVPWPQQVEDPERTMIAPPGSTPDTADPEELTQLMAPDAGAVATPPDAASRAGASQPPRAPSVPPTQPSRPPQAASVPPVTPPTPEPPRVEPLPPEPPAARPPRPRPAPRPAAGRPPMALWAGIAVVVIAGIVLAVWQPWRGPGGGTNAPGGEGGTAVSTDTTSASALEAGAGLATLRVETTPPDAQVSLDDGAFVPSPATFTDLEAREHTVRVKRDSFQVARRVVPLSAGLDTTLVVTLRPAQAGAKRLGLLLVTTEPADATVVLDGEQTASAPARFRNLTEGEHTVEVRREGYVPRTLPLVARAAAETSLAVALAPLARPGVSARTVIVRTQPAGGMVSLNGSPSRREPARFEGVGPGTHNLRARLGGSDDVDVDFALSGLRDTTLTLVFGESTPQVPMATLVLWSRPPADFYVERKLRGEAMDSVRVPIRANRDVLVYIKEASPWFGESAQNSVRARPGEVKYVGRDFTRDGCRLDVDTPGKPGAEVLIDGRHTGRFTPAVLYVKAGTHRVHVVAEGWKTSEGEQTLRFKGGQPLTQTFTLVVP